MCTLNLEEKVLVERAVKLFVENGEPFTGRNIAVSLPYVPQEVSSYVREIFNRGDMPGWASTQVVPKIGPVLYFKVNPRWTISRHISLIKSKIDSIE